MQRILPETLRKRYPRMANADTLGQCAGQSRLFHGLPCPEMVRADNGFRDARGKYFCVKCGTRAKNP